MSQKIIQIGCGSVGSCMLALYLRHIPKFNFSNIHIIDMRKDVIEEWSKKFPEYTYHHLKVTKDNYIKLFTSGELKLNKGDLLLDLSWYVSTLDVMKICYLNGAMYVNTAVETWDVDDCKLEDKACQTLYTRAQQIANDVKFWNRGPTFRNRDEIPTMILTHGANPGWVSHATKLGLADWVEELAKSNPNDKKIQKAMKYLEVRDYPNVARVLNVQAIHISEKDTQISNITRKIEEFANTWSPEGFVEEAVAPAELGWGTHETLTKGVHKYSKGPKNQVYFDTMGMNTLIRSHVPSGDIIGMVVRHEEAYSLSKYLTVLDGRKVVYRPTVHYAYQSCPDSIASLYEVQANGYKLPTNVRLLRDDIIEGQDELGVFMLSKDYGCWWIGSLLDNITAKKILPGYSATVTQIAPSVMASVLYALKYKNLGVIHPEQMDEYEIMDMVLPYLGKFVSYPLEWKPNVTNTSRDPIARKSKDWIIQKLLV